MGSVVQTQEGFTPGCPLPCAVIPFRGGGFTSHVVGSTHPSKTLGCCGVGVCTHTGDSKGQRPPAVLQGPRLSALGGKHGGALPSGLPSRLIMGLPANPLGQSDLLDARHLSLPLAWRVFHGLRCQSSLTVVAAQAHPQLMPPSMGQGRSPCQEERKQGAIGIKSLCTQA